MARIPDWIKMDSNKGTSFCDRCEGEEKIPLPMSVTAFAKWSQYFAEKHKDCKEPPKK